MTTVGAASLAQLLGQWQGRGPAFRALADRVLLQLVDGRVAAGTRLPAERELAGALGVSRTTVAAAYAHLRAAGCLCTVRGSGSVLRLPGAPDEPSAGAPGTAGGAAGAGPGAGSAQRRTGSPLVDLTRAALPGAAEHVLRAAHRALEQLPAHLGGPGYELLGVAALRAAVAERYTRRGLPTRPDQVLVTLGAQHGVGLVLRTLTAPGDRVLVESPGYPHALEAVRGAGGRPVPVPVAPRTASSPGGWDVEALEEAFTRTRPALGHLMPGFHNPTGAVMPAALRARVCELARRCGTTLVVDETTNDLPIDPLDPSLATSPGASAGAAVPPPFPADVV
ncbi:aminotransferase class I/II-fold pyridoxal phosphate-dependent enzyme, partial [Kineococcus sp. T13]|uniref:aminotransferase class I/II-fold pyridoxal phosphate-dependent enzyme n=1 Tax=Kineococcus vitellinus TaxID=2696565 RepID=UPI00141237B6|nr:aminotransferase class I/II-fold pyridoxal phosphate-dependent enzyme [Kineococcus vitellinus]